MADTYVGSVVVDPVTLESGLIEVVLDAELDVRLKLTIEQFEAVKSDVAYPDGQVSVRKWNKTIAGIITLLAQDNAELNDTPFVLEHVASRIDGAFKALIAKMFNVNNKENITVQAIFDDVANPKIIVNSFEPISEGTKLEPGQIVNS